MRKLTENRGSIMIWTLLMGIILATVFFFFSQRLNANQAAQRETIKFQNANTLMESYANYLESLIISELETIRDAGDIDFNGITGTLTNQVPEIVGELDAGEDRDYAVALDDAQIEFNLCANNETGRPFELDSTLSTNIGFCGVGDYDGAEGHSGPTFNIAAPDAPVSFRITPVGAAELYDERWFLDLEMIIGARKKLTLTRTFIP